MKAFSETIMMNKCDGQPKYPKCDYSDVHYEPCTTSKFVFLWVWDKTFEREYHIKESSQKGSCLVSK